MRVLALGLVGLTLLGGCTETARGVAFGLGLDERKPIGQPVTLIGTQYAKRR
ncbi:MAG: hypothetical protein AAF501_00535 [Pseudomonadota bacterium]